MSRVCILMTLVGARLYCYRPTAPCGSCLYCMASRIARLYITRATNYVYKLYSLWFGPCAV